MQTHTPDLPPAGPNASARPAPGPAGHGIGTLPAGPSPGAPRARADRGPAPQALHERVLHLERGVRPGCPAASAYPPDHHRGEPVRPFALSLFTPAPAEPAPCAAAPLYWLVEPGSADGWPGLPGVRVRVRGRGGFVGVPPQGRVCGPGVYWRVPLAPGRYLTGPAVLCAALAAVGR